MNYLTTTPKIDGFYMPAEWEKQQQIWMLGPERTDNWRLGAKPAQQAFASVALAIAEFEPVTMCVSAKQYQHASSILNHSNIRLVEMSSNDSWMRDVGPTFVRNKLGEIRGVDWQFNAWGGLNDGLYLPWDLDDQVAHKVLSLEKIAGYRTDNFVLEGGSIHVDGEGTLITTEECLLNSNRNPHLSRMQIEQKLKDYLAVDKVIWLPFGLFNDETNGHIDNFCCFVAPAEVLLAWTDDPQDPNYKSCSLAYEILTNTTDAKERRLHIHKIPLPAKPIYASEQECATVDKSPNTKVRENSVRLAASYVNFLLVNGGVIVPGFADENDVIAKQILEQIFKDRKIVMLPGREILLGGGNIHCITQQQPA